jgi:hypothetical protein
VVLVVPPGTAEAMARSAMAQAADRADMTRAPAILAATPARPPVPVPARDDDASASVWDNEGGPQASGHS